MTMASLPDALTAFLKEALNKLQIAMHSEAVPSES